MTGEQLLDRTIAEWRRCMLRHEQIFKDQQGSSTPEQAQIIKDVCGILFVCGAVSMADGLCSQPEKTRRATLREFMEEAEVYVKHRAAELEKGVDS